jgi:hypothetical protein
MEYPIICFTTITKNNENNILKILENINKYINYFIIIDIGSTDNTCNLIRNFSKDKNIICELLEYNIDNYLDAKNFLFKHCFNKTDFILYTCVNEELVFKDFNINDLDVKKSIGYYVNTINNNIINKKCLFYNNRYIWEFSGILDEITISIDECKNNYNFLGFNKISEKKLYSIKNLYQRRFETAPLRGAIVQTVTGNLVEVSSAERIEIFNGVNDCDNYEKYKNNTNILLEKYENNLVYFNKFENSEYIYLIADRYFELKNYEDALFWFLKYNNSNKGDSNSRHDTNMEKLFISFLKTAICLINNDYPVKNIVYNLRKAISIFQDRAEPYYISGNYFISKDNFEVAYFNFKKIENINYQNVINKYDLFINKNYYGLNNKFILAYIFYKNERLNEAIEILNDLYNKLIDKSNKEEYFINYDIINPDNLKNDNNEYYILVNKIKSTNNLNNILLT